MYLQKEENGAWFVKLATGFDSPDMIDSDNKKQYGDKNGRL